MAVVAIIGACWSSGSWGADNLAEAMAQAYLNNPDLGAARAVLRGVDEAVPQALSGWRPTVSVDAAGGYEHSDTSRTPAQDLRQVNGTLSVMGSVIAMIASVFYGVTLTLTAATCAYVLAAFSVRGARPQPA